MHSLARFLSCRRGQVPTGRRALFWSSFHTRGMLTKMPDTWAGWKATRNWIMACTHSSSGWCVTSRSPEEPLHNCRVSRGSYQLF